MTTAGVEPNPVKKAIKRILPIRARRAIRRTLHSFARWTSGEPVAFYNPADFPFTASLEANWRDILDELLALEQEQFAKWPEDNYTGRWEVFGLYAFGRKLEDNCRKCPVTAALVAEIPGLTTAGFSVLMPGTHIRPHVGYTRTVLRCHLGLVIPDDCGIRVGNETRVWRRGECMVFDDTVEHEAWNHSSTSRIVLLFDFVKPGKTFDGAASEKARELFMR